MARLITFFDSFTNFDDALLLSTYKMCFITTELTISMAGYIEADATAIRIFSDDHKM